jgi:hypothetical protein
LKNVGRTLSPLNLAANEIISAHKDTEHRRDETRFARTENSAKLIQPDRLRRISFVRAGRARQQWSPSEPEEAWKLSSAYPAGTQIYAQKIDAPLTFVASGDLASN